MARFFGPVLLALAIGLASCSAKPKADLVVLAGQSNALGYLTRADVPVEIRWPDPEVRIWRDGRFEMLEPGRNTGSPNRPEAWGPEASFARVWRETRRDRPLYIVKLARGSTSLAPAEGRDWSPASGELFAEATREVEAAKAALSAQGRAPRIAAILWVQGEADAIDPAMARAYRANLTSLIKTMRLGWSAPQAVVAVVRIPDIGAQAGQVRAAQAAVDDADPLTVSVDAKGLPMQADGLHIAASGQVRLGQALARAVLPLAPRGL
ncbi:sialate O-acetylesterase [Phenylobacterium sp. VNQ135]|uniref:sialate O-acetylesterase n=1 Tax=Phenylobacterium sp. VNQ135 TaxID=3400922 RepID=UPI003C027E91